MRTTRHRVDTAVVVLARLIGRRKRECWLQRRRCENSTFPRRTWPHPRADDDRLSLGGNGVAHVDRRAERAYRSVRTALGGDPHP